MGTYTTNLNLYNTDMNTDGNDTFDFQRDLNDNNDKIDSAIGKLSNLTTEQQANLVSAINEIVTNLDGKTSKSLNDLNAVGQAILDKKVEVEALLAQNGYAKFSWKENNEISILLFQWGINNTGNEITFPLAFTSKKFITSGIHQGTGAGATDIVASYYYSDNPAKTYFFTNNQSQIAVLWFAVGS